MKSFAKVCLLVLVVSAALLAGLPRIVSLDAVRNLVVDTLNRHMPGRIQLESWSLRWFGGIQLDGFVYEGEADGTRIALEQVRTTSGLFDLVKPVKSLGVVHVVQPDILIGIPAAADTADTTPVDKAGPVILPVLPVKDVTGKLRVREGRVRVRTPAGDVLTVMTDLNTSVTAEGVRKPLAFSLTGGQHPAGGQIDIEGTLVPAAGKRFDEAVGAVETTARLTDLALRPLTYALSRFTSCPPIRGQADATFNAHLVGSGEFDVNGEAALTELLIETAAGEPDAPLADVRLRLTAKGADGTLSELAVVLDAPFVQAHVSRESGDALQVNLSSDLDAALAELGKFIDVQAFQAQGTLNARATVSGVFEPTRQFRCEIAVQDFALADPEQTPWEESSLQFALAGAWTPAADAVVFDTVKATAEPLLLEGSGAIRKLASDRHVTFRGTWVPDLAKIARRVNTVTGVTVDISGAEARELALDGPLTAASVGDVMRTWRGKAGLFVDRVNRYGATATNVNLSASLEAGQLAWQAAGQLNGGRLDVTGSVEDSRDVPVVRIAPAMVIRDAALTTEMAQQVLAGLHPVFANCVILGGYVDVEVLSCRVPLRQAWPQSAAVDGRLRLHQIVLEPDGLLHEILALAGLGGNRLALADQQIGFVLRDGRVAPTPLTISIDGHDIRVSGSVALDGTLDYGADIPITRDMVGRDVYRHLAGRHVRVPIGGTVTRPVLERGRLKDELSRLAREGARDAVIEAGGQLLQELFKRD